MAINNLRNHEFGEHKWDTDLIAEDQCTLCCSGVTSASGSAIVQPVPKMCSTMPLLYLDLPAWQQSSPSHVCLAISTVLFWVWPRLTSAMASHITSIPWRVLLPFCKKWPLEECWKTWLMNLKHLLSLWQTLGKMSIKENFLNSLSCMKHAL